jgi:hypothetical protein
MTATGWLRKKALLWTVSTAGTLVGLRFITPGFVDLIFDVMTVGLVYLAGALARSE